MALMTRVVCQRCGRALDWFPLPDNRSASLPVDAPSEWVRAVISTPHPFNRCGGQLQIEMEPAGSDR